MGAEAKALPSLGPIAAAVWISVVVGLVASGVILAVVLTLPETYTCDAGEQSYYVKLIDKPTISSVSPSIICPFYEDKEVLVNGWPFMVYNDEMPDLSYYGLTDESTDNCTDFTLRGQHAQLCTILKTKVPRNSLNQTYFAQRVRVVLPLPTPPHPTAAPRVPCFDDKEDLLTLVPAPIAYRVDPPIFCNSSRPVNATISGRFFLSLDDAVPKVTIGSLSPSLLEVFLSDCEDIPAKDVIAQSCRTLTFSFIPSEMESLNSVSVSNPSPADCGTSSAVQFRITNAPQLNSVTPQLVCASNNPTTLVVNGDGFLSVNNVTGTLYVGTTAFNDFALSSCSVLPLSSDVVSSCQSVTFDVPAQLPVVRAQGPFSQMINFSNPIVSSECMSSLDNLVITAPPIVDLASPPRFCNELDDVPLTITGPGFLFVDGVEPTITVGGSVAPITQTLGCTSTTIYTHNITSCLKLVVMITPSNLTIGDAPVNITNPAPYDCNYVTTNVVEIVATPVLATVLPATICARDDGDTHVSITGSLFSAPTVTLVSQCNTLDCLQTADGTIASFNSTLMDVAFTRGALSLLNPGTYGFQLTNGFTCTSSVSFAAGQTVVVRAPVKIISVAPEYIYNKISVQGYLFTENMRNNQNPTEVLLISTSTNVNVSLALGTRPGWDTNFNRIRVIIPAGLDPGFYDVRLTNPDGCVAIMHSAFLVGPGASNIALSVYPNGVTSGAAPVPVSFKALASGVNFVSAPRIYLTQSNITSIELTSFSFSTTELIANVPDTSGTVIPVGVYDVYVINPTGDVGYLPNGFVVSSNPMPTISSVAPESWTAGTTNSVTVTGTNFGTSTSISLTANCINFYNSSITSTLTSTIDTVAATSIAATFDLTTATGPLSCTLTLVNAENIQLRYSSVRVQSTAGGADWTPDSANIGNLALNRARAGHATAVVRPTPNSAFLYVFGGALSGGSVTNTVEYAAIDEYGRVVAPFNNAANLRRGVRLASATVAGSFVYFGGGIDSGNNIRDDMYRAYIMPPSSAPFAQAYLQVITDTLTAPQTGGVYYYCVSAVHDDQDPKNPSGETLCSTPMAVRFPEDRGQYLAVLLRWNSLSHVDHYNIYRTQNANDPQSSMVLYDTTNGNSYLDDFQNGFGSSTKPLMLGALGVWDNSLIPTLNMGRAGFSLVNGPRAGSTTLYSVFALFGSTSGNTAVASYEWLPLDLTTQTELANNADWTQIDSGVPARTQSGAAVLSSADTSNIPAGQTNIYIPGGISSGNAAQNDYRVATITNTGVLSFAAVTCTNGCYTANVVGTGYCFLGTGSELSMWGGALGTGGLYNTVASSTTLSTGATPTAVLGVSRSAAACTSSKGAQYISGGSASGTPTTSVQFRLN